MCRDLGYFSLGQRGQIDRHSDQILGRLWAASSVADDIGGNLGRKWTLPRIGCGPGLVVGPHLRQQTEAVALE